MQATDPNIICPGCHGRGMLPFYELHDVPVNVGRVADSVDVAKRVPRGDIRLCYCPTCGLVYNTEFDPNLISFEPGYEVALHHSQTFRDFITGVAERLIATYELRGRKLLDIGCGSGFFLETLCRLGGNYGVGIDPTVSRVGEFSVGPGTVQYVRDFWSDAYEHLIGDFISCQSVFEDIPRPLEFLTSLRSMLEDRRVPIYFEVFNGFRAFEEKETWSIHYEECNYFNLTSLKQLFELAGFQLSASGHCYQGDQYLYVEAIPGEPRRSDTELFVPEAITEFSQVHAQSVADWTQRLGDWTARKKRVVMWGSGGKGVNFLNSVPGSELITQVVDINPDRQGKFVPGSGQTIVAPASLVAAPPDIVILTNPIYRKEIMSQIGDLGIQCDVLHA